MPAFIQGGLYFSSFKTHANRKHANWQDCVNNDIDATQTAELAQFETTSNRTHSDSDAAVLANQEIPVEDMPCSELCCVDAVEPLFSCPPEQRTAALFLQEKSKVSQTAINFAVGSINTIVDSICEGVQTSLVNEELLCSAADTIKACFSSRQDPFVHLQKEYKPSKFYRESFGLIVSFL